MVLSFSVVYVAVATVTRLRVLEALFGDREGDRKKDREILDSSDNRVHNLSKILIARSLYILKYRYVHELIYAVFGVCLVCLVRMHAHSAGISS